MKLIKRGKNEPKDEACEVKSLQNVGGLLPSGVCGRRETRRGIRLQHQVSTILHTVSVFWHAKNKTRTRRYPREKMPFWRGFRSPNWRVRCRKSLGIQNGCRGIARAAMRGQSIGNTVSRSWHVCVAEERHLRPWWFSNSARLNLTNYIFLLLSKFRISLVFAKD